MKKTILVFLICFTTLLTLGQPQNFTSNAGLSQFRDKETNTFEMLSIYPNPAKQSCKVEYDLNKSVKVRITVYDLLGKIVKSETLQTQTQGRQSIILNTAELKPGIYLTELSSGSDKVMKRLIVTA